MQSICGEVKEFRRDAVGRLNGLVLEDGQEVLCSPEQLELLATIFIPGSWIEIKGDVRFSDHEQMVLSGVQVTDLNSKQTKSLPAPVCVGKAGMLSHASPTSTASLALPDAHRGEIESQPPSRAIAIGETTNQRATERAVVSLRPGSYFHNVQENNDSKRTSPLRNRAARRIGLAYDRLHGIQAILAYLHIMKHRILGISQFLEEAKHTYEQALARFTANDFAGAREFADASCSLSRVVEIMMSRALRSDASLPSLVPPPPDRWSGFAEPEHVEEELAQAASVLSKIHWVLENGTLPSEDRAQVRKIAAWGDAFYKQAQYKYKDTVLDDASEFAQAALAGANSAEHVCRKWYVSHPAQT